MNDWNCGGWRWRKEGAQHSQRNIDCRLPQSLEKLRVFRTDDRFCCVVRMHLRVESVQVSQRDAFDDEVLLALHGGAAVQLCGRFESPAPGCQ